MDELSEQRVLTIPEIQNEVWRNKVDKGFNVTDVPTEFCLLMTEVGEAFDAWRKSPADLGDELADVLLFTAAVAQMNNIDLNAAVTAKMARNRDRVYVAGPNGLKVSKP